jgi:hypothetical protein
MDVIGAHETGGTSKDFLSYSGFTIMPALNQLMKKCLQDDLKSIGVTYIEIDEDGRSSLIYPEILHSLCNKQKGGRNDGAGVDRGSSLINMTMDGGAAKAIEDVTVCTKYFYHLWMWIQFPFLALGNCDHRYNEGITQKLQDMSDTTAAKFKPSSNLPGSADSALGGGDNGSTLVRSSSAFEGINKKLKQYTANLTSDSKDLAASSNSNTFKLPEIKFNRKAAKSIPRVIKDETSDKPKLLHRK